MIDEASQGSLKRGDSIIGGDEGIDADYLA
jgi:hypothetical protein